MLLSLYNSITCNLANRLGLNLTLFRFSRTLKKFQASQHSKHLTTVTVCVGWPRSTAS